MERHSSLSFKDTQVGAFFHWAEVQAAAQNIMSGEHENDDKEPEQVQDDPSGWPGRAAWTASGTRLL